MKLQRFARLSAVALVGVLALAACGSNNNTSPSSSSSASSSGSGAAVSASSAAPAFCASGTLNGSGSTAQANAMTQWIKDYQTACPDATVNYGQVGSGQGIKDFLAKTTSFGGSDSALSPTKGETSAANGRCAPGTAVDLPMVPGPIAVVYNVPGADNLVFTPAVLAGIFSGKIAKWNDPAITALNPSAKLPAQAITTFHRSDASGTSDNFTEYLAAAAGGAWSYGHDKQWKAPGGQGAKGSAGVAQAIKSTQFTISYDEYSYARDNQLQMGQVDNGAGPVTLTPDAVAKAVAAAKIVGTGDDLTLSLDYATKAPGAYPILLVTYEITCVNGGLPADQAALVKGFLSYVVSDAGQQKLVALGYAPLPTEIRSKVQAVIAKVS